MLRKNYIHLMLVGFYHITKKMHTKKNRIKSGWDEMSLETIHFRLRQEELELYAEIHPAFSKKKDYRKILSEFCDVAAFALFGIWRCTREILKERIKK